MGQVCCCCADGVEERRNLRTSAPPGGATSQRQQRQRPRYTPPTVGPSVCATCGVPVDPALLEGHQESCRTNHKRGIRTTAQESVATAERMRSPQAAPVDAGATPPVDALEEDAACVVCFEGPKVYAFVPCGHLSVCKGCAPRLDECPVCRDPKTALLYVEPTERLCVCKHCRHVIGPTFFDSHREVCALRMRQAKTQPATTTDTTQELLQCTICRTRPRDTALLPCGHHLLCSECASTCKSCPGCCTPVVSTTPVYAA